MSRKLISDLFRLLRVVYVTFLFFQFLRETSKKHLSFFVVLRFVLKFHRNWFGLKTAFVFSKCFVSNISCEILKLFVFHAVAHLLGTKLVGKKKKQNKKKNKRSPAASLGKFTRAGLTFGKLSQTAKQLLAKSKHDFLTAAALEMPARCCPSTAILIVSKKSQTYKAYFSKELRLLFNVYS